MIRAKTRGNLAALTARLTERVNRRLADRRPAGRTDKPRQTPEANWRSAEALWPDFALPLHRVGKD